MAEILKGSFVFTILDEEDSVYFVRGNNPLTIYDFYNDGFYLYASTKDILSNTMKKLGISKRPKYELEIKEGDILKIDCYGETEKSFFDFDDWDDWYFSYFRGRKITALDSLYDIALQKGIPFGRPKKEIPDNFFDECRKWLEGEQTAVVTMKKTGLKKTTFYRMVNENMREISVKC